MSCQIDHKNCDVCTCIDSYRHIRYLLDLVYEHTFPCRYIVSPQYNDIVPLRTALCAWYVWSCCQPTVLYPWAGYRDMWIRRITLASLLSSTRNPGVRQKEAFSPPTVQPSKTLICTPCTCCYKIGIQYPVGKLITQLIMISPCIAVVS